MRYINLIVLLFTCININAQSWEPVGAGVTRSDSNYDAVMALYPYHGKLYIGGKFVYSGTRKVNSLACWNGTKIDTVGRGLDSIVSCFTEYKGDLVIGGKFNKLLHTGRTSNFVMWNDSTGSWSTFDGGIAVGNDWINALRGRSLCEFNDELYVGGGVLGQLGQDQDYSMYSIEKWTGKKWTGLKNKTQNTFAQESMNGSNTLIAFRGKLYIGAIVVSPRFLLDFTVVSWDGRNKEFVGIGHNKISGVVEGFNHVNEVGAFAIYDNNLYAAGWFDTAGGKQVHNIAKWNDTSWSPIGTGVNGKICAMAVYNGKLYVGGNFDSAGGKPTMHIAVWDGKTWSAVGEGLEANAHGGRADNMYDADGHHIANGRYFFKGRVTSLAVYNNELYAGGTFDFSGNTKLCNLARLKLDRRIAKPKPAGKK